MTIKTEGYNIPKVTVSETLTAGTAKTVGTQEDFDKLYALCDKSGIATVSGKIGSTSYVGTGFVQCDGEGMEFDTITNKNNTPIFISIHIYMSGEDMKAKATVTSLTSNS